MTTFYDWVAQALSGAPLAVQLIAILVVALPLCGAAAAVLLRLIDFIARPSRGSQARGGELRNGESRSTTQSRPETTPE